MKAVAAALVLIAGAAVVLWYGNTLNSWVLGGLIGGLAALLLSIPISLTLFSYLSHRHDQRMKAVEPDELDPMYAYPAVTSHVARPLYREVESYALAPDMMEDDYEEEEELPAPRHLSAPSSQRLPMSQRSSTYSPAARQQGRHVPLLQGKDAAGRRTTQRRMNYPGFPGYEPGSSYSQHRSEALRLARQEAARRSQMADDLPSEYSRRPRLPQREESSMTERPSSRRPSRSLDHGAPTRNQYRSRRTVDAASSQDGTSRALPPAGGSSASRPSYQRDDPYTDSLDAAYLDEEPLSRTRYGARSSRRRSVDRESSTSDLHTDNLRKPLVRRAPYTYDDDDLRYEFSRQVDTPAVRRSSLYLSEQHYDEQDEEY